ncbi:DNA-deoxyinosine glycosylase [Slackia isoflavoniconvertens]|uniref:NAD(P)H-hydrate epimerase n=1 Tax=Slackia isoflavoniconvertens TaxID=572010 RepID=A0A3N0I701_9ACTN|nr:DNA-deoxyinosine glycosylase [Slackia isoflavoniconvertens]MBB3279186.1 hypoxanthine-DNA glycosylase [Slackia isoflavoniconvertens]RNM32811.1 DNA-deoxyinosine glycosylase [Slackia isoflavoniconvertens]
MDVTTVTHEIQPVFDSRSRVLLLGTMPSPASREQGFYYGHPQNRFWRVIAAIFDEPAPRTIEEKRDMLLHHHVALWDVLASCEIEGASDASIRDAQPNDLARIFDAADIRAVFATGTKAGELYRKLIEPTLGVPCTTLPSTSPANAKMKLADLVGAYGKALLPLLGETEKHVLPVADVVKLEKEIAKSGTSLSTLMERAGRALAKVAFDEAQATASQHDPNNAMQRQADAISHTPHDNQNGSTGRTSSNSHTAEASDPSDENQAAPHIAILCGSGNNGGDGWVAARELARAGCAVDLVTKRPAREISAEPAHEQALLTEAIASKPANTPRAGLHQTASSSQTAASAPTAPQTTATQHAKPRAIAIHVSPSGDELACLFAAADVIVDAILGTGFSGDSVLAPYDAWIRLANEQRSRGARIVAADVPSGLSAQTGKAAEPCLKAHETVTMIASKPGLETPYAFAFCGTVHVAPLAYIEPILESWKQRETVDNASAGNDSLIGSSVATDANAALEAAGAGKPPSLKHDAFRRAETEDDDGYDPYSDRPPTPEPLFQADPWN